MVIDTGDGHAASYKYPLPVTGLGMIAASGASEIHSSVNKFGRSVDVDSSTDTDIWDGADGSTSTDIWVAPTTARKHNIVSSSANDAASGTGARTVEIQGLDGDWALQTETVTLNGTTNVATAKEYLRIFRMKVMTAGSGKANAGIIKATAQTDNTVTAAIQIGNNQTLMAIYTVPAGKTAYMTNYYASVNRPVASSVSLDIRLLVKPNAGVANSPYQLKHILGMYVSGAQVTTHRFNPYFKISEKSDVIIRATDCTDNNTDVAAGFDLILVNN